MKKKMDTETPLASGDLFFREDSEYTPVFWSRRLPPSPLPPRCARRRAEKNKRPIPVE
jgi:hypothetical protein